MIVIIWWDSAAHPWQPQN